MANGTDYGKRFEEDFFKSFSPLVDVSIDRVKDQTSGYKGDTSICDFIVYSFPNQFYLELKSYNSNTIPTKALRPNQFEGLMNKQHIQGVRAGALLQFRHVEPWEHYYIPISYWMDMKAKDKKSINLDTAREVGFQLHATKLRTRYRYEPAQLTHFLEEVAKDGITWKKKIITPN